MTNATWKTMPTTRACDMLDFWAAAPWPMNTEQTVSYAAQLGWTSEEEDGEIFIVNSVDNFNNSYIDASTMPSGEIASMVFYLTDTVRGDINDEATAFLRDYYTLFRREAIARWGESRKSDDTITEWDLGDDAGYIYLTCNPRSVTISFDTPQYAKVLRELGE